MSTICNWQMSTNVGAYPGMAQSLSAPSPAFAGLSRFFADADFREIQKNHVLTVLATIESDEILKPELLMGGFSSATGAWSSRSGA